MVKGDFQDILESALGLETEDEKALEGLAGGARFYVLEINTEGKKNPEEYVNRIIESLKSEGYKVPMTRADGDIYHIHITQQLN